MAGFFARKHLGGLRPADEHGEQMLQKIKQGEDVWIEVKRPRNSKHHRYFWVLMTLVWENLPDRLGNQYPSVEDLVAAVKVHAGHRKAVVLGGGMVVYIPKSIAFAKMDQTAFDAFFDRVCDVVAREFVPDITSKEWRREVEAMIGSGAKEAA